MFSVLKVRKNQKPGDYSDPGRFKHPAGTMAKEYAGAIGEPVRNSASGGQSMPRAEKPAQPASIEVQVRKPSAHSGHGGHGEH
jgi:hypothetical protein